MNEANEKRSKKYKNIFIMFWHFMNSKQSIEKCFVSKRRDLKSFWNDPKAPRGSIIKKNLKTFFLFVKLHKPQKRTEIQDSVKPL